MYVQSSKKGHFLKPFTNARAIGFFKELASWLGCTGVTETAGHKQYFGNIHHLKHEH